jgi:iron-sulfur cluster repair protein YtfE (RIC family)
MLVQLGKREATEDLVALLLECHARIRRFVGLAGEAAAADGVADAEVREVLSRCERYFMEALPLHVEDEEQSLLPRLQAAGGALAHALDTMRAEHLEHAPGLQALLEASRALRTAPREPAARARLASVARQLGADFERHLIAEEQIIFPALRALPSAAQREILAELRERRARTAAAAR